MVVARLGPMDRARCDVSRFEAPPSGAAGTASEERQFLPRLLWEPERSAASGPVSEPATTTDDQVAWRPARRESATLWKSRSSSGR
eukprot:9708584-Alexandrium_andersonii.AAC.1